MKSKLPNVGTTIFTTMSALAKKHQAINLSQGFPDFDCDTNLKSLVTDALNEGYNQYAPMAGLPSLQNALALKINNLYKSNIYPDEITVTAGATQGIFTAIQALIHYGDEVIVIEPAYDSYIPSLQLAGAIVVPIELVHPTYSIDWELLESRITNKTRMIIINTPHNPTGSILRLDDLNELERLVLKHNLLCLSDEVYEHLIYDSEPHQSILRFPDLYNRSIAIYSFGKTFHNTGWKIGYVVAPPRITSEFRKVHQFNVFCVNSFLQHAITEYLNNPETYLHLPQFYQEKRDYFRQLMKSSGFKAIPSKGSYFELYDYSDLSDLQDEQFAIEMTKQYGVACIPLNPFYVNKHTHRVVRFCFAKKKETLQAAAQRLTSIKQVALL
ncbi:MAG: aminotransferase class I/II-fold pyridoxal phosphate-dependent enzyme [Bacteroidia bacterium]|nr:aminotransferase class I/II-fold pyridoxal phosphate-dependent enzyme [Bacteroidia bacterium]